MINDSEKAFERLRRAVRMGGLPWHEPTVQQADADIASIQANLREAIERAEKLEAERSAFVLAAENAQGDVGYFEELSESWHRRYSESTAKLRVAGEALRTIAEAQTSDGIPVHYSAAPIARTALQQIEKE